MYPSLCYQLLFSRLCVCMEQCRIGIFAPISIPEQFGDPNYSKVFWQTGSGSEGQGLLGTPLGVVAADLFYHRFLRGCKISFYHGPVLTASREQCAAWSKRMHETTGTDASSVHTIHIATTQICRVDVAKETAASAKPFFLHEYVCLA